jgi:hypothetical protein
VSVPHAQTVSTGGDAAIPRPTKPWEQQMDMLLQRLMMNSFHSDADIRCVGMDSIMEGSTRRLRVFGGAGRSAPMVMAASQCCRRMGAFAQRADSFSCFHDSLADLSSVISVW